MRSPWRRWRIPRTKSGRGVTGYWRPRDWAVLPDSPLDAQSLEAVKTYRQALRDVPQQERFPSAITWPQMPELANQP